MEFNEKDLQKFDGWEILSADGNFLGQCHYSESGHKSFPFLFIRWNDGETSTVYDVTSDSTRQFTGSVGKFDAKIIGENRLQICS